MSAELPALKKLCSEGVMSKRSVTFVTGNAKKLAEVNLMKAASKLACANFICDVSGAKYCRRINSSRQQKN